MIAQNLTIKVLIHILYCLENYPGVFSFRTLAKELRLDCGFLRTFLVSFICEQTTGDKKSPVAKYYILHIGDSSVSNQPGVLFIKDQAVNTQNLKEQGIDLLPEWVNEPIDDLPLYLVPVLSSKRILINSNTSDLLEKLLKGDESAELSTVLFKLADYYPQISSGFYHSHESITKEIYENINNGYLYIAQYKENLVRVFGLYYDTAFGNYYAIATEHTESTHGKDVFFIPTGELQKAEYNVSQLLAVVHNKKLEQIEQFLWSPSDLKWDEKPSHFRILVEKQDNVIAKIEHTLYRFHPLKTVRDDGRILFEFDAFYNSKLLSWLLSYGSSVIVLSPKEVQDIIISEYDSVYNMNKSEST